GYAGDPAARDRARDAEGVARLSAGFSVTALFRPSEHEPLAGEEWSEEHAEEAIAAIVADAESAFDGTRWPWHPSDGEEEWGYTDVYIGGAGMIWALDELDSSGWEDAAVAFVDHYRARPSPWDEDPVETSYHFGEVGIALVASRLTRDAGLPDRLHELVLAGLDSEANEVMYGTPGLMLVAEAMVAWTGEPRWDEAWRAAAERVEAAREGRRRARRDGGARARRPPPPRGGGGRAGARGGAGVRAAGGRRGGGGPGRGRRRPFPPVPRPRGGRPLPAGARRAYLSSLR